tara:strand:+ start:3747 stop:4220 length:474 start_codon:yes stop_codon:yes gene_type:complete
VGQLRTDLKEITANDVTTAQLNSAGGRIFLSSVYDLKDAAAISDQVMRLRTFGAFPCPDTGAIAADNDTGFTLRPDAGQIFLVSGISIVNGTGAPVASEVRLYDGSNILYLFNAPVDANSISIPSLNAPLYLTNNLYLVVVNASPLQTAVSYTQVVR